MSRRSKKLNIKIPRNAEKENLHLILDSTGLKVFGEGEWKVRKHGHSKRRTWRKLHIAMDKDGELRAVELTENDKDDASQVEKLIKDDKSKMKSFAGDGAYDKNDVYKQLPEKTKALIPPQKNARIKNHGNKKRRKLKRDENIRGIRKLGRRKWKESVGYHIRSLGETCMFRFKTVFGDKLFSRSFVNQVSEASTMASILNRMSDIGLPVSVKVG
jgi:hypothetical protein